MHLIYLIHGTWPNGPLRQVRPEEKTNWFHPASALSGALAEQLVGTVRISPFTWSGANSTAARTRAAEELATKIAQDCREQSPDGVFLVAHSHGGTVAVEMLFRHHRVLAAENVHLAGIVCMASPFVFISEASDVQREDSLDVALELACLVVLGAILLAAPNVLSLPWYVLFVGGAAIGLPIYVALGIASQLLTTEAYPARECLPPAPPKVPPIDLIRAPADEASGLIGFAAFFKWMLGKLYIAAHRTPTNWQETKAYLNPKSLALRLPITLLTASVAAVLLMSLSEVVRALPPLNIVVIAFFISGSVLALPTMLAYTVFALTCGLRTIRRWGLVGLDMEPSPPAVRSTMHLLPAGAGAKGLAHALHSWESVHKTVVEIIRDRISDGFTPSKRKDVTTGQSSADAS